MDLLRYVRFEQDPRTPGRNGAKRTPSYVAFVVLREGVARVELGDAVVLDRIVAAWRKELTGPGDGSKGAAGVLRNLVWKPVAAKLGIGTPQTVLNWVRKAQVDAGQRPGVSTAEAAELRRLRAEVKQLRLANDILKTASAFFAAAELDRRLG